MCDRGQVSVFLFYAMHGVMDMQALVNECFEFVVMVTWFLTHTHVCSVTFWNLERGGRSPNYFGFFFLAVSKYSSEIDSAPFPSSVCGICCKDMRILRCAHTDTCAHS